jgi:hypothetical protein
LVQGISVRTQNNPGSATLISPKNDPTTYFVAKKVLLNKIKDNEKFSAKQEVDKLERG